MEYVIIVDNSIGNASVGEMWKETYIFNGDATLHDVMTKLTKSENCGSKKNIIITRPFDRD